ncbi:MAG: NAD-dependent epimerase/dehydratase family protein [Opitutaceae bacterium]|nr:NAD-dependent epimerase/dehydratase family protein [Opitutaceae bacterium]
MGPVSIRKGSKNADFSGRQLLVLGAGYVGEALCRQALARGIDTTALTRNREKAQRLATLGVHCVIGDIASREWHDLVPRNPDLVVNCVSSGGGGIEGYRHSYLDGMASMVAWACTRQGAGTLVYTSSTSVYPQGGGVRVDESASLHPPASEHAGILINTEEIARTWPGRVFILRLTGIYGPGRHHLLDALRAGETVFSGKGDHRLNLVHLEDILSAVWRALTASPEIKGEAFNVTDDEPVTKADLVGWLSERVGREMPSFADQPSSGRRTGVLERTIDNARIKSVLGWAPLYPNFREGYRRILEA